MRFKSLLHLQQFLKGNERLKAVLLSLFPPNFLGAIDMWLTRSGNLKPIKDEGPDSNSRNLLKDYYYKDVLLFEDLYNIKTPWTEFSDKSF